MISNGLAILKYFCILQLMKEMKDDVKTTAADAYLANNCLNAQNAEAFFQGLHEAIRTAMEQHKEETGERLGLE